jgi:chromosome segregation ATPase
LKSAYPIAHTFAQLKGVVEDKESQKQEIFSELSDARELLNREAQRVHEKTSAVEGKIVELQEKNAEQQEQLASQKMEQHTEANRAAAAEAKVQEVAESYAGEIRDLDARHAHFLEQMMQRHAQETHAHSVEMKEALGREKEVQASLVQQEAHVTLLERQLHDTHGKIESTRKAAKMYRMKVQALVGEVKAQAAGFDDKRRGMDRRHKTQVNGLLVLCCSAAAAAAAAATAAYFACSLYYACLFALFRSHSSPKLWRT